MEALKTTGILIALLVTFTMVTVTSAFIYILVILCIPVALWYLIHIIRSMDKAIDEQSRT